MDEIIYTPRIFPPTFGGYRQQVDCLVPSTYLSRNDVPMLAFKYERALHRDQLANVTIHVHSECSANDMTLQRQTSGDLPKSFGRFFDQNKCRTLCNYLCTYGIERGQARCEYAGNPQRRGDHRAKRQTNSKAHVTGQTGAQSSSSGALYEFSWGRALPSYVKLNP